MELYEIQVPITGEFAGHSVMEELAIVLANNYSLIPLQDYQNLLAQLFAYLPRFSRSEQREIIRDIYDASLTRADVLRAITTRGSCRRMSIYDRRLANSFRTRVVGQIRNAICSVLEMKTSAKLRSIFWYSALMYATDYSKVMLIMQILAMGSVLFMISPRAVPAPNYMLSAVLVGFRHLLDAINPFEMSSSSIIIGLISMFVVVATVGLNHSLLHTSILEYIAGLFIIFFTVTGSIWMF